MNPSAANLIRSHYPTIVLCGVVLATCGCSLSKVLDRHIANQERTEPLPPKPSIAYLNQADKPLAPGSADVYRLLEAKQYKKARAMTTQMLESELASPEEKAEYYLFRGVTNRLLIDEKSGFEDLNKSIELNPNDWRAYYARREFYENRSMREEAKEDGEKARQLHPTLSDPRVHGGVI